MRPACGAQQNRTCGGGGGGELRGEGTLASCCSQWEKEKCRGADGEARWSQVRCTTADGAAQASRQPDVTEGGWRRKLAPGTTRTTPQLAGLSSEGAVGGRKPEVRTASASSFVSSGGLLRKTFREFRSDPFVALPREWDRGVRGKGSFGFGGS